MKSLSQGCPCSEQGSQDSSSKAYDSRIWPHRMVLDQAAGTHTAAEFLNCGVTMASSSSLPFLFLLLHFCRPGHHPGSNADSGRTKASGTAKGVSRWERDRQCRARGEEGPGCQEHDSSWAGGKHTSPPMLALQKSVHFNFERNITFFSTVVELFHQEVKVMKLGQDNSQIVSQNPYYEIVYLRV